MNSAFRHQRAFGVPHSINNREISEILSKHENFKTWGFFGDPTEDNEMNSYYIVVNKLPFPNNKNYAEVEVDYKEFTSVLTTVKGSWFCCEFFYSFDEFKKSNYRGTFKIEICKENKLLLDWIAKKRKVALLGSAPPTMVTRNHFDLIEHFSNNPGFIIPFRDVSGLVFNDTYMELLQ